MVTQEDFLILQMGLDIDLNVHMVRLQQDHATGITISGVQRITQTRGVNSNFTDADVNLSFLKTP